MSWKVFAGLTTLSSAVLGAPLFVNFVTLQPASPGTADVGHINVTGQILASGIKVGSGPAGGTIAIDRATSGNALYARSQGNGVFGQSLAATGLGAGGYFVSNSAGGRAVIGESLGTGAGAPVGGLFTVQSTGGIGAYGLASAVSGTTIGVKGSSKSTSGTGVFGETTGTTGTGVSGLASALTGSTVGVKGVVSSNAGFGVLGEATSASGGGILGKSVGGAAVEGRAAGADSVAGKFTTLLSGAVSVLAKASGSNSAGMKVIQENNVGTGIVVDHAGGQLAFGVTVLCPQPGAVGMLCSVGESTDYAFGDSGAFTTSSVNKTGVRGQSFAETGTGAGVYGVSYSASGYGILACGGQIGNAVAIRALGDTQATGNKSFIIDHPLDPKNKELLHYSAEGPEPYLVYRGNVVCGTDGSATVTLPAYFEAINRDLTYQLTCIGGSANVYVAEEVRQNRFRIAGGRPGLKVSWQVTGVRDDAYERANGYETERLKTGEAKGRYHSPDLYHADPKMAIGLPGSQTTRRTGPLRN